MSSPDDTNMTNPPKSSTKMVKIKANYPIRVGTAQNETIVQPGGIIEVTEDQAKEFCDKKIDIGYKDTFGDREKRSIARTMVARADRV